MLAGCKAVGGRRDLISNKLKFVTNPFGAASLCDSFLVLIVPQAQSVNLGALSLEILPFRRLNKKGHLLAALLSRA